MALRLSAALRRAGTDVELFCFESPRLLELAEKLGVPYEVLPHWSWYKSKATLPRFALHFRRRLLSRGCTVLHSHLLGAAVAAGLSVPFTSIRHVATIHDTYTLAGKRSLIWTLRALSYWRTEIAAVSAAVQSQLRELGGFRPARMHTVPNGVEPPSPLSPQERRAVRETLGLLDEDYALICVARLVPLKAHGVLLEALTRLDACPSVKLLLVGTGPQDDQLRALARDWHLDSRVHFLGERTDVPRLLQAADCFVLSSDTEGLSCSILEAMAAGLPCVVTDVGGNRELVQPGLTGSLLPPRDPAAFARAIRALSEDIALGQACGARARARVDAEFSLDRMVTRYARLYGGPLRSR
jgi:glycosyltransferase involved in cell wall biosynthesis